MNTPTAEAIFIPIDLEMSLGRIEESRGADEPQGMDCEGSMRTRTSEHCPFHDTEMEIDHHIISPYPYSETTAEISERHGLRESVGKLLPSQSSERVAEWAHEEAGMVPNDDDFSLSTEDAASLADEDFELEKLEDPVSFFEAGVEPQAGTPNLIPLSSSFSSHADARTV